MKKYLMSGVAAIAFLAAFTSCSKSTDLYDQGAVDERNRQEQEKKDQQKVENVQAAYENAFKNAFGTPAAGQDWGFGDSNAATRAFTRAKETYNGYRGDLKPVNVTFPDDAPASKFLSEIPDVEKLPASGDVNGGSYYIDNTTERVNMYTTVGAIYVKGNVDLTSKFFEMKEGSELYLPTGSSLKLDASRSNQLKVTIYIASGATLETDGVLKMDNTGKVYNHGNIKAASFEVNSNCFLYNVGKMELTGRAHLENQNTAVVNDGTIICGECYIQGSANVQNNAEWTVKGNTVVNSNYASWINNGHWTTQNYQYSAGSENVINNCYLEVKNDFNINTGANSAYSFKIDSGGGVLTQNFNGGGFDKNMSDDPNAKDAVSGPYKVIMGHASVFKVTGTATLEGGNKGWGFFGPADGEYAVFQATKVVRAAGLENTQGAVTYGGNLYVSAETHFAQGNDGQANNLFIYEDNFNVNTNIYAPGFNETGAPSITIEETPCNPGFEGQETEPTEVRVICEDLFANSGSDFDFNDLVFDVVFGTNAKIIIRAAGGTLPIYINGGTEIHELMGYNTKDENGLLPMLNTGAAAKGLYGVDNAGTKEINLGIAINKRKEIPEKITIKVVKDGTEYTLQNNKEAATMICVGTDFTPWMGERDQLKIAYPKFVDFVQTGKPAWNKWYK